MTSDKGNKWKTIYFRSHCTTIKTDLCVWVWCSTWQSSYSHCVATDHRCEWCTTVFEYLNCSIYEWYTRTTVSTHQWVGRQAYCYNISQVDFHWLTRVTWNTDTRWKQSMWSSAMYRANKHIDKISTELMEILDLHITEERTPLALLIWKFKIILEISLSLRT